MSLGTRMSNRDIHTFTQTLPETSIAQIAAASTYYSGATIATLSPYATLLPQYASMQALFDQYRITNLHYTFRPNYVGELFTAADIVPQIYVTPDFDDNIVPTSVNYVLQYQQCKTHMLETFTLSLTPHCANALFAGAFNSFGNMTSPWIDWGSTAVPHYGVKIAVSAGAAAQTNLQRWWVTCRVTIQCKNVR